MSTTYKDYYKLLGVERNSSDEEIARAFKKLARKYHPDLNPNNKQAEEHFKEVNEAYEVLKDPQKRKLYDQLGSNWQHGQAFQGNPGFTFDGNFGNFDASGFSDFFESLFGGKSQFSGSFGGDPFARFTEQRRRGKDIESTLTLSLEDVVRGGNRSVTIATAKGPRSLNVTIPQGIREGQKLRLSGQGEQVPGGVNGDLFLIIHYKPHERFRVNDKHLICDLPLTPWEAVLGTHATVETLEGSVELSVPAGTSSGQKFRIRGRGLGSAHDRGDILVQAMIRVPKTLSEEEKALWEKLQALSTFQAR